MTQTIGERIMLARKQAKMSQAALADRIGITPQAIGNTERGNNGSKYLHDIASVLSVSYEHLKTGTELVKTNNHPVMSGETASYDDIKRVIPAALDRTLIAIGKKVGVIDTVEHRELISTLLSYAVICELSDDYTLLAEGLNAINTNKKAAL